MPAAEAVPVLAPIAPAPMNVAAVAARIVLVIISCLLVHGPFGPELLDDRSDRLQAFYAWRHEPKLRRRFIGRSPEAPKKQEPRAMAGLRIFRRPFQTATSSGEPTWSSSACGPSCRSTSPSPAPCGRPDRGGSA